MLDNFLIFFGFFYLIACVACGLIAATYQNKHPGKAFFLGFFLGPLGVALVWFFDFDKCTYCGFRIASHAKHCPGCHNEIMLIREIGENIVWPCSHCGAIVKNKTIYQHKRFPCPVCKSELEVPDIGNVGFQVTIPNSKHISSPAKRQTTDG